MKTSSRPAGRYAAHPAGPRLFQALPISPSAGFVLRGGARIFVYKKKRIVQRVAIGTMNARDLVETDFFRRVDLADPARTDRQTMGDAPFILFGLVGPSIENLSAELVAP